MAGILLRPSFLLLLSAYVVTNLNLDGLFPLWFCKLSRTTAKKEKRKNQETPRPRFKPVPSKQILSPKNRTFRKLWNCPHISNSATLSWAWVIYRHLANYMWKVVIVMTESRYRPCCKQEERGCFQKNHDHNTTTQQIKLLSLSWFRTYSPSQLGKFAVCSRPSSPATSFTQLPMVENLSFQ